MLKIKEYQPYDPVLQDIETGKLFFADVYYDDFSLIFSLFDECGVKVELWKDVALQSDIKMIEIELLENYDYEEMTLASNAEAQLDFWRENRYE